MRKTLLFSLYLASATHLLAAGIGFAPAASKITRASKMVAVAGRACTANSIRSYEEIIPPVPSSIVEKIQKTNYYCSQKYPGALDSTSLLEIVSELDAHVTTHTIESLLQDVPTYFECVKLLYSLLKNDALLTNNHKTAELLAKIKGLFWPDVDAIVRANAYAEKASALPSVLLFQLPYPKMADMLHYKEIVLMSKHDASVRYKKEDYDVGAMECIFKLYHILSVPREPYRIESDPLKTQALE